MRIIVCFLLALTCLNGAETKKTPALPKPAAKASVRGDVDIESEIKGDSRAPRSMPTSSR